MIKLPTGKADAGVSTGKADFSIDGVVSKEAAKLVEVSGYGGYEWRGSPDGFDIPGGAFRWGTGLTFPSRNFLRVVGELNGFVPSSDVGDHHHAAGRHRRQPLAADREHGEHHPRDARA